MAFPREPNPFSPSTLSDAGEHAYNSPRQYSDTPTPATRQRRVVYHDRQYADEDEPPPPPSPPQTMSATQRLMEHIKSDADDVPDSVSVSDTPRLDRSTRPPISSLPLKPREPLFMPDRRLFPLGKSTISRDDTADKTLRYERGLRLALGLGAFPQSKSWRASEEATFVNRKYNDNGGEADGITHKSSDDYVPIYTSSQEPPAERTETREWRFERERSFSPSRERERPYEVESYSKTVEYFQPRTRTTSYRYNGNTVEPYEYARPTSGRDTSPLDSASRYHQRLYGEVPLERDSRPASRSPRQAYGIRVPPGISYPKVYRPEDIKYTSSLGPPPPEDVGTRKIMERIEIADTRGSSPLDRRERQRSRRGGGTPPPIPMPSNYRR